MGIRDENAEIGSTRPRLKGRKQWLRCYDPATVVTVLV